MTGRRYGKLTVLRFGERKNKTTWWVCRCDCGTEKMVRQGSLRTRGRSIVSCGCITITHHMSKTSEYQCWKGILRRCLKSTCKTYVYYGGRGIGVCKEWLRFENFIADMGRKPSPRHEIERNNNDGPYCKDNCRWATRSEQNRNHRRVRFLTYQGITLCVTDWAKRLGVNRQMLYTRLSKGLPIELALALPPQKGHAFKF